MKTSSTFQQQSNLIQKKRQRFDCFSKMCSFKVNQKIRGFHSFSQVSPPSITIVAEVAWTSPSGAVGEMSASGCR
eukprot:m.64195 g.64195  ORF g.64195 m.64195 type:complete len:75 (+) comp23398_c0_seq1:709-933(+)